MSSKITIVLVFVMCVMTIVGCSPKINIKDAEGNVEISVDGDLNENEVDIEVKTEDGNTQNMSAKEGGKWPSEELPKHFPEFKVGSISGTTITSSNGIKVVMIVISGGDKQDYIKYAEGFEEDGYSEIVKTEDDEGFMWVQQKNNCSVTVGYTKSTNGGMVTVQVDEQQA
jgi:hypothetical protein